MRRKVIGLSLMIPLLAQCAHVDQASMAERTQLEQAAIEKSRRRAALDPPDPCVDHPGSNFQSLYRDGFRFSGPGGVAAGGN